MAFVAFLLVLARAPEKVLTRNLAWESVRQKPLPRGYPGMGENRLEAVPL